MRKKKIPRKKKSPKTMEELTEGHEELIERLKKKGVDVNEDSDEFEKLLKHSTKPSSEGKSRKKA